MKKFSLAEFAGLKVWSLFSVDIPVIWPSPFFILYPPLYLKYGTNTKINTDKVILFMFRRLQNNVMCFSISNTIIYIKAEIWPQIITVSSIKVSSKKNKYCKQKACWVKSIIPIKSIHHWWKVVLIPFKNLNALINNEVSHYDCSWEILKLQSWS